MKRLLANCMIFALLAALTVLIFRYTVGGGMDERRHYTLPPDKHILLLGNSHIECSIDDKLVDGTFNFGRSGDRMEHLYAKARLLLKYNPGIDTVVIGWDNMIPFHESAKDNVESLNYPDFLSAYTLRDHLEIFRRTSGDYKFTQATRLFNVMKLRYMALADGPEGLSTVGGYYKLRRELRQSTKDAKREGRVFEGEPQAFDPMARYFLDRTIAECRRRGVAVVFLTTPQYFKEGELLNDYREVARRCYPDIPYYDYIDMEFPDSCHADRHHLNYRGAKVFSEYIDSVRFSGPSEYLVK